MLPALFKQEKYPYDVKKEVESIDSIETVEELDELLSYLDELEERGVEVALDTETVGVDPKKEAPAGRGRIVTVQLSWIEEADSMSLEELVEAISEKEVEPTRVWIDCRDPAMLARMKPWCERNLALKVMHGSQFDTHQLWNHGIVSKGVIADTLQMSREQYPERLSHSLDGEVGLVRRILGEKRLTTKQALGVYKRKKNGEEGKAIEFRDMLTYVEDEEMRPFQQVYSTFDVYDTIRLYYVLQLWMREMEWENRDEGFWAHWTDHGSPLMQVLIRMERRGVCVDKETVETLLEAYQKIEAGLIEKIYAIIGAPVNLNSSPQKSYMLFGEGSKTITRAKKDGGDFELHGLGLLCKEIGEFGQDPWQKKQNINGKWTEGCPSTDKEHLEWALGRVDADSDEARLLGLLRDRGEINKLITGTLEPLLRNLRPRHKSGVREPGDDYLYIHSNFSPVARTGRLSSSNPNLQQIPSRTYLGKRIRHAFTCEEGEAFIVADYSQLELNILSWYLASLFGDISYAELLRGGDIHQITADKLGIKRYAAKAVNFGILYGMSEFKLAVQLGIPVPAARVILHRYYDEYPYVEQYGNWAVEFAKQTGSARTMLGRYRQLPNIDKVNRKNGRPTGAARADERRAKNSPIQGSAQDIVATAMIDIDADEELKDYGFHMCLQVHDEIAGVAQSKYRFEALKRLIYIMENAITFPEFEGVVRFPVEGSAGLTWGEGKCDGQFSCSSCRGRGKVDGEDCPICFGEGEFNVKRAGDIWVAEAA